jgi:hypothetical protein
MQGLTTLSINDRRMVREDFNDQDLCPFLSVTKDSIFQEPMDEVLWRAIRYHLRCQRIVETDHAAMETKGWIIFHITFYEILGSKPNDKLMELWPSGELHSDHQHHQRRPRRIRESALTVSCNILIIFSEPTNKLLIRSSRFLVLNFLDRRRDQYFGQCCVCDPTNSLISTTPKVEMTLLEGAPTRCWTT